jgi:hypothetical protein
MGRNREVDMAIVLKHSMNALAAIKKIGIPQHQYDWLVSSGVSVKLTSEKFVFVYPTNDPLAQVSCCLEGQRGQSQRERGGPR